VTNTLIVAPAWVGDMIMSQPLYALLKQQGHSLDVLAPRSTLPLAKRMTEIENVIESPFKHGELNLKNRRKLSKQLRNQYQQAIILPNSLKSALIPWWANIPKRTGWLGEKRYFLLNDYRHLDKDQLPSLLQRYAKLGIDKNAKLPDLSTPSLLIDEDNKKRCCQSLSLNSEKPIIALCPGAEYGPSKRWPAKYYAKVAEYFLEKNWQVWIFGTAKEQDAADEIQAQTNEQCVNLAGKTKLLDAIDLLSMASIALSNDSGLMHIAAAVNIPVVAVYGSTSPIYTPPATNQSTILQLDYDCIPCFKRECPLKAKQHLRCLRHLHPETVLKALEKQLS
jgi:heptosyltransferase II